MNCCMRDQTLRKLSILTDKREKSGRRSKKTLEITLTNVGIDKSTEFNGEKKESFSFRRFV